MRILAVNFGHDASLTLLDNGEVKNFLELERITRMKHTVGVVSSDIVDFLAASSLTLQDIDLVAVGATQFWGAHHSEDISVVFEYSEKHNKYCASSEAWQSEGFANALEKDPGKVYGAHLASRNIKHSSHFLERVRFPFPFHHGIPANAKTLDSVVDHSVRMAEAVVKSDDNYRKAVSSFITPCTFTCRGVAIPAFHVAHHYAHACYGHYYSASENSLIVSHDGGLPSLPFNSGGVYYGSENKVVPLLSHKLPLGYVYDQVSMKAGFNEGEGAGKLMGLAPYGFASEGLTEIVRETLAFCSSKQQYERHDMDMLIRKIVFLSNHDRNIRTHAVEKFDFAFVDRDHSIAMAANSQKLVEEVFTRALSPYLNKVLDKMPSVKSVGLVGGFTLNCPANTLLQISLGSTYLNPLPGAIDSGISIGAAVAVASYLGHTLVRHIDAKTSAAAFPASISKDTKTIDKRFEQVKITGELDAFIAEQLAKGKILCLHRERSEIGPRALGHRSIIAKASSAEIRDYINKHKGRENWRPLAPICRQKDFGEYFSGNSTTCRFMLFTYPVTTERLPGITHVDGTARVQTVDESDALLDGVLKHLPQHGEPAVIINTSFNTAGEPIVETVEQSFSSFHKLGFDYLVIEKDVYQIKK